MRHFESLALPRARPFAAKSAPRHSAGESAASPARRMFLAAVAAALTRPQRLWGEAVAPADTSRQARDRARQGIPFGQLTDRARQKIASTVERPTLFRRMPAERIECDPLMFQFLVRYPEVVVGMWRLMDATKIQIRRVADYVLDANDGNGTQTRVELIYGSNTTHVMLADGEYSGPMFRRKLSGRSVLVLQSSYSPRGNLVTSSLDVFLALNNLGADLVARTIHPVIGRTADHNFAETARFLSQVSQQAVENPGGMARLADRLDHVDQDVRRQFRAVVSQVANRDVNDGPNLTAAPARVESPKPSRAAPVPIQPSAARPSPMNSSRPRRPIQPPVPRFGRYRR